MVCEDGSALEAVREQAFSSLQSFRQSFSRNPDQRHGEITVGLDSGQKIAGMTV
jgi:hypothetical protein